MQENDVDLNEPTGERRLLHMAIGDEDLESVDLILSMPREGYKTKSKVNLNLLDDKLGWTPLVAAINQGARGFQEGIDSLLRAGADPLFEVAFGHMLTAA